MQRAFPPTPRAPVGRHTCRRQPLRRAYVPAAESVGRANLLQAVLLEPGSARRPLCGVRTACAIHGGAAGLLCSAPHIGGAKLVAWRHEGRWHWRGVELWRRRRPTAASVSSRLASAAAIFAELSTPHSHKGIM